MILDVDGSLTGTAGHYVAADYPLLVTPQCSRRGDWNAWICPHRFGSLRIEGQNGEAVAPMDVRRDDGASGTLAGPPGRPQSASLSAIPGRGYALAFRGAVPARPRLHLRDVRAGDVVIVSLPYAGSSFRITRDYDSKNPLTAAASRAAFEASAGDVFLHEGGMLHVKLLVRAGKDYARIAVDPG